MKRLLMITLMFCILSQAFGVKISSWRHKNKKGQEVITEKYINEPDGKVKVIDIGENGVQIERTIYYKGNQDYKEKEIGIYENGKLKTIHTYYIKDNPEYYKYSLSEFTDDSVVKTTDYSKNPKNYLKYIEYKNISGYQYKDELIFDRTEGCIRQDFYFENNEVKRIENFFNNDKSYMTKAIAYYKSFKDINNNIMEREEQYYENHPNHLKKIDITINDDKQIEELYYEDHPDTLFKIIKIFKNKILLNQEQYYSNHPKGYAKIVFEYSNGVTSRITAYDKDGKILQQE